MEENRSEILVTGGAGFIGSHLIEQLLENNYKVTIVDNFDVFYSKEIKLKNTARAGVRSSIKDPIAYQDVNVKGSQKMLEFARHKNIRQFIFASSSSVCGFNKNFPWKESDVALNPISPYGSTKISGELLGHVYSHLFGIRFIALRFFTVFGPRQRPDLAIHQFSKKILNGEAINYFGNGSTRRDYTYVADTVQGIFNAIQYTRTPFGGFNLRNHYIISLSEMIQTLETVFHKKAIIKHLPEQMGDVPFTYADISKAEHLLNYAPKTNFKQGITKFKNWLETQ